MIIQNVILNKSTLNHVHRSSAFYTHFSDHQTPLLQLPVVLHDFQEPQMKTALHSLPFFPITKLTFGPKGTSSIVWHMKFDRTIFSMMPTSASDWKATEEEWQINLRIHSSHTQVQGIPHQPSQNQAVAGSQSRLLEMFDGLLSKGPIAFSCIQESLSLLLPTNNLLFKIFLRRLPHENNRKLDAMLF